jgi:GT2 family glycosyltransferase
MDQARRGTVSILAVIVLYKTTLDASATMNTLRSALAQAPRELRFKTLVYDNSPATQTFPSPPTEVTYIADSENSGLSKAYNLAAAIAEKEGYAWILTLDQDTELSPDFLRRLTAIVETVQENQRVASILPRVMQGERLLSPNWFALDFFARPFPPAFNGVPEQSGYGFNSAATVRVSAIQAIGGYSPLFPLDYSDAYLYRRLHLANFKAYIAGDLLVEHHLSILNTEGMSEERYRNVMATGSAFCDLMRGRLVGAEFTFRLMKSYLGLLVRKNDSAKTRILAEILKKRLFRRRSDRIKQWLEDETKRGLQFRS